MIANNQTADMRPGLNILLVDGEDKYRRMIARAIDKAGHSPTIATSGEEAMRLLDERTFDLAIIDEHLSGRVSGVDVIRKADSFTPPVPVILTGFSVADSELAERPRNISSYIPKPFDARRVEREVQQAAVRLSAAPKPPPVPAAARAARRGNSTVPPPSRARRRESREPRAIEVTVSVVIVEADAKIRGALLPALASIGCRVVAFASPAQAESHVRHEGYNVLVARTAVIEANPHWRDLAIGSVPLGTIAIAIDEDTEDHVRAAYLGARGVFEPPFDPERVASEFRQALTIMRDELRRRSTMPAPPK
jgi:DNA-binding NtrC family response regulator